MGFTKSYLFDNLMTITSFVNYKGYLCKISLVSMFFDRLLFFFSDIKSAYPTNCQLGNLFKKLSFTNIHFVKKFMNNNKLLLH